MPAPGSLLPEVGPGRMVLPSSASGACVFITEVHGLSFSNPTLDFSSKEHDLLYRPILYLHLPKGSVLEDRSYVPDHLRTSIKDT